MKNWDISKLSKFDIFIENADQVGDGKYEWYPCISLLKFTSSFTYTEYIVNTLVIQ